MWNIRPRLDSLLRLRWCRFCGSRCSSMYTETDIGFQLNQTHERSKNSPKTKYMKMKQKKGTFTLFFFYVHSFIRFFAFFARLVSEPCITHCHISMCVWLVCTFRNVYCRSLTFFILHLSSKNIRYGHFKPIQKTLWKCVTDTTFRVYIHEHLQKRLHAVCILLCKIFTSLNLHFILHKYVCCPLSRIC